MKRVFLAAVLLGSYCFAQQPASTQAPAGPFGQSAPATATVTEQLVPVTRSDMYCSGFLTRETVSRAKFVAGGLGTPDAVHFADRDLIYLKGTGYQPGSLVSIVREWKNPDAGELYKGVRKMLAEAGQPYQDAGYARVVEQRGDFAVARVEFACDTILAGDLVMPFAERPQINVRKRSTADLFPVSDDTLTGNIVLVREGDQLAAVGRKVFLNIGSDKGVKPGDYFQVIRSYSKNSYDEADQATMSSTMGDDTQKNPPRIKDMSELPKHLVGELVVLNVCPGSSTAMVTFMMEDMHAGDKVALEKQ
jgi:hypothetical protein